jgi:hypothetical protein
MPEFNTYVDVEVYEIWDSCSTSEKNELIDLMEEEGYVKRTNPIERQKTFIEESHIKCCEILMNSYISLSVEDIELIKQIANKYS